MIIEVIPSGIYQNFILQMFPQHESNRNRYLKFSTSSPCEESALNRNFHSLSLLGNKASINFYCAQFPNENNKI